MTAVPDIETLRKELQDIHQQRDEVNERLRTWGRGRGGRGDFGRGDYGAGRGRGEYSTPGGRGEFRGELGPRGDSLRGPPGSGGGELYRPGGSGSFSNRDNGMYRGGSGSFGRGSGEFGREYGRRHSVGEVGEQRGSWGQPPYRTPMSARVDRYAPDPAEELEPDPFGGPKKKLLSAVVVDGAQVSIDSTVSTAREAPGIAKRPLENGVDDNPAVKKRNRRMFGALLGTLQAFRKEDAEFQRSAAAQKRAEALQRADAKAAEEAVRMRQLAREEAIARRQAEIAKKRELNAAADIKRMEIVYAEKCAYQEKLCCFLLTVASPPLMWLPREHCPETQALLEGRAADLVTWQENELERLEAEKARVIERSKGPPPRRPLQPGAPASEAGTADGEQLEDADNADEHGADHQNEEPRDGSPRPEEETQPAARDGTGAGEDVEMAEAGGEKRPAAEPEEGPGADDRYRPDNGLEDGEGDGRPEGRKEADHRMDGEDEEAMLGGGGNADAETLEDLLQ